MSESPYYSAKNSKQIITKIPSGQLREIAKAASQLMAVAVADKPEQIKSLLVRYQIPLPNQKTG